MKCRKLLGRLLPVFLLFITQLALAQSRTVNGRVTDAAGIGLPLVTVAVKGQNTVVTTNENGQFAINVPAGSTTLVFSSVGFAEQEIAISDRSDISVTMQASASNLSEVVVVGYGTARRRDLTGSVATVSSKDFQKGNISTPEQLIAGKVPGVSIISNSGQPGAGSTIRIRGGSSLSASNDPLIVIDGVPLAQSGIAGAPNPLSFINANDVESFTVLKDASSAAIYGTRAANGVIIITTKKGQSGKLKINFNSTNSLSRITNQVELLNADQVRELVNEFGSPGQKAQLGAANTNWQDQIYQSAFSSDNNINLSGGIKKLPYRLSLGYQRLTGVLKTDKVQKTSIALALNPTFFADHLKVDLNLKGSGQENRFANQGAIGAALFFDPTQPVYSNDKRFGGFFEYREPNGNLRENAGRNPLGLLEQTFDEQSPVRSIGNIQFDYKFHFLPDLRANLNLGYDVSKNTGTYFIPDSAAAAYRVGGVRNPGKQTKQNSLLDFYLNYVKELGGIKSRIDFTAGYSYNNFQSKNYFFRSYKANGDTVVNTKPPNYPFDLPENTLLSYFSRLNYAFNDRYLLTATIRRDGSSRFAEENRWGTFPSLALAWNIKRESFLNNNNNGISDLKLRVGYGVTGQQEGIGNYDYIARYGLGGNGGSYGFGNTYYQTFGPFGFNSALKWEETETYNAAIDYGFFKGRVNGSVDFYLKKTTDLLNNVPQPTGTNFALYVVSNVGSMENKGVEFNLNVQPIRNSSVAWDMNFNATYNKNTITNLTVVPNDPTYIGLPGGGAEGVVGFVYLNAVGGPKNTFYMYKQVYDKSDKPMEGVFEDLNRDGIINEQDRYKAQSADPDVFLGFSSNVNFNKWNAGFVMRSNLGNYMYNNVSSSRGRQNQVIGSGGIGNASVNYLDTRFLGTSDKQTLSDYYLENASFLRMDNFNIGYNFGGIYNNKASLRIGAVVQNVFVISKYNGLDPESSYGIDGNFYPRPRTFSISANLDF